MRGIQYLGRRSLKAIYTPERLLKKSRISTLLNYYHCSFCHMWNIDSCVSSITPLWLNVSKSSDKL